MKLEVERGDARPTFDTRSAPGMWGVTAIEEIKTCAPLTSVARGARVRRSTRHSREQSADGEGSR